MTNKDLLHAFTTLPVLKFVTLKKKKWPKKKEYKKRLQLLAYDYTRISYIPVSNVICVHLSWGEIIFVVAHVFSYKYQEPPPGKCLMETASLWSVPVAVPLALIPYLKANGLKLCTCSSCWLSFSASTSVWSSSMFFSRVIWSNACNFIKVTFELCRCRIWLFQEANLLKQMQIFNSWGYSVFCLLLWYSN